MNSRQIIYLIKSLNDLGKPIKKIKIKIGPDEKDNLFNYNNPINQVTITH